MPLAPERLAVVPLLLVAGCTATSHLAERSTTIPHPAVTTSSPGDERPSISWPRSGQASYDLDGAAFDSPGQSPVPIASVAKLMTAYVVVHHLSADARVTVDSSDVADVQRRRSRGESVVDVQVGEVLSRDQALAALLLPSANNVAAMLAERVGGNWPTFLQMMNETARVLGMNDTNYTDPSGYQPTTTSTAHDQLLLLRRAMRTPSLARIMALPSANLPVVGVVHNTNRLLGHDGFVAGKTGSTSAAGGCFVFRVVRGGHVLDGAVLGQQGGSLITAGLTAARSLADEALSAGPAPG